MKVTVPTSSPLKRVLKRGALVAAANWEVTLIQATTDSLYKLLLATPVFGGVFLVGLVLGSAPADLMGLEWREMAATIITSLVSHPAVLAAFVAVPLAVAAEDAPHPAMLHAGLCDAPGAVVADLGAVGSAMTLNGTAVPVETVGAPPSGTLELAVVDLPIPLTTIVGGEHSIVVVTDANPTLRVLGTKRIVQAFDQANRSDTQALTRLFVFALGADANLGGSQIKRFLILHKELDADDGELTRTRKVRRRFIGDRYMPLIDGLYSDRDRAYIKTTVTFEDGRTGTIEADLAIREAARQPVSDSARKTAA